MNHFRMQSSVGRQASFHCWKASTGFQRPVRLGDYEARWDSSAKGEYYTRRKITGCWYLNGIISSTKEEIRNLTLTLSPGAYTGFTIPEPGHLVRQWQLFAIKMLVLKCIIHIHSPWDPGGTKIWSTSSRFLSKDSVLAFGIGTYCVIVRPSTWMLNFISSQMVVEDMCIEIDVSSTFE